MDLEGKEEGITVIHVFVVNSEPDRFNGNEWMTTILECKKAFGIDEVLNVAGIFFREKIGMSIMGYCNSSNCHHQSLFRWFP